MAGNNDDREQRRRFSSIQREFGGAVRKKPAVQRLPSPKDESHYQMPKLKRAPRRPSHEHETLRLEEIPEELVESDVVDDFVDASSSSASWEEENRKKAMNSTPGMYSLPYEEYGIKEKVSANGYSRKSTPGSRSPEKGELRGVTKSTKPSPSNKSGVETKPSSESGESDGFQTESRKISNVSTAESQKLSFSNKISRSSGSRKQSQVLSKRFQSEPSSKIATPGSDELIAMDGTHYNTPATPQSLASSTHTKDRRLSLKSSTPGSDQFFAMDGTPYNTPATHVSSATHNQSKSSKNSTPNSRQLSFQLSPKTYYSVERESLGKQSLKKFPHSEKSPKLPRQSTTSNRSEYHDYGFDSPPLPAPPSDTRKGSTSKRSSSNKSRPSIFSRNYSQLEEEESDEFSYTPEKRNSIQFPVLQDSEKIFHELVADGHVELVEKFLNDNLEFNINCVSFEKTSALQVAIRNLNEPMVVFLLGLNEINACDAVLTTIKTGDLGLLITVLECLEATRPGLEFAPCPFSADFADDVTPLMLAAQEGEFEILDVLLNRGHRMPDIHHPSCRCRKCKHNLQKYDYLKYSTMKINQYKAIASPMYFFQTTSDPLRRAFELTGELQAAARMFPQFHADYEQLWKNLRIFSAEFIGCCRNSEEVELILNQPAGCDAAGALFFPRLQFAIDTTQKEFVAHPFVQAVLESAWTGEATDWKTKSVLSQALAPFVRIPVVLVGFILSCCLPMHGMRKKFQSPVNKFISSLSSYIIFLAMIISVSAKGKQFQKRGPPNSGLEWPIVFFVIGHVWGSLRLCFQLGPKRFFSMGWNWFDCITQLFFILTFIFWIAARADVIAYDDESLPRKFWHPWDPTLIAEGLFAIATIMSCLRLYVPMSLNYYVGPHQVSIEKMMLDISKFVLIFSILFFAWSAGLSHFYEPYSGMVQTDPATGEKTTQIDSFVSFSMSLKTFFWAIFGMTPIEAADVVIENPQGTASSVVNQHVFTQAVGYVCFAAFIFIGVIVFLNMLVACMANTFTKVIDNIPVEWVFGRTKIYITYMYHSMFPSPLNLIPKLDDLTSALSFLTLIPKKRAKCSWTHCCYTEQSLDSSDKDFQNLMADLAQRYLRLKRSEDEDDTKDGKKNS